MKINDILTIENTAARVHSESKKSALEVISKLITQNLKDISPKQALHCLIMREKLGSTAVGYGVAIPHARLSGLHKPIGALIHLTTPIDFDAPDDEPVDLLFGLLMPEDNQEAHTQTLSLLAERFRLKTYREQLRHARNADDLYHVAVGDY